MIDPNCVPTPYRRPRVHLAYLDGIRALAALYVMAYHALFNVIWSADAGLLPHHGGIPASVDASLTWLRHGPSAVSLFIVLSGYCLMLPVADSPDERLKGGFLGYIRRRARRILPPYYMALLWSGALIVCVHGLHQFQGVRWDANLPVTRGVVISHLLLFHDLRQSWFQKLNSPAWSIAVEWQIYFLLPVLIAVWRRAGLAAMLGLGLVLGLAPSLVLHNRFAYTCPWYIALFTFGAGAAAVNFSGRPLETALRGRISWGGVAAVLGLLALAYQASTDWRFLPPTAQHPLLTDLMIGLCVASGLVFATNYQALGQGAKAPLLIQCLETRPLVFLGVYSYSIYLVHDEVLGPLDLAARHFHLSPLVRLEAQFLLGVPLVLVAAYLFHLAFERPFMVRRKGETPAEVARDAALSPAP